VSVSGLKSPPSVGEQAMGQRKDDLSRDGGFCQLSFQINGVFQESISSVICRPRPGPVRFPNWPEPWQSGCATGWAISRLCDSLTQCEITARCGCAHVKGSYCIAFAWPTHNRRLTLSAESDVTPFHSFSQRVLPSNWKFSAVTLSREMLQFSFIPMQFTPND
jgi:hypothetical protein